MFRRWKLQPRYRLRTLLVVITALCVLLTALPFEARQYKQHKGRMRSLIAALGGEIETLSWSNQPSPGANWLSEFLGYVEPQESLWRVSLAGTSVNAADLKKLSGCRWIVSLSLSNTNVGDDALVHVAGLSNLVELRLRDTRVTDAGVLQLKALGSLLILDVAGTGVSYQSLAALEKEGANLQEQLAIAHARAAGVIVDLGTAPRRSRPFRYYQLTSQSAIIASIEDDLTEIGLQPDSAGAIILPARKLTSEDDEDLRRLVSAKSLATSSTLFPVKGLEFISKLKNLQSISINEGEIGNLRDNDLRWLAELPQLNALELRSRNFTGAGLSKLTQCAALTSLTLEGKRLTDIDLQPLAHINKLEHLSLHGDNLTPALLEHLKRLTKLRRLELHLWHRGDGNKPEPVSGDGQTAEKKWNTARPPSDIIERARRSMHHLAGMPNLEQLSVMGNLMVIEVLGPVTKVGSLEWLKVDGRFVSHDEARRLQLAMPHCHVQRIELE
jgi:hypothetical protein